MGDCWINGKLGEQLSVFDRGCMFGDGFFTTMAVRNSQVELFQQHQYRVKQSLMRLAISVDESFIWSFIQKRAQNLVQGGLKLVITRGQGEQGYQLPSQVNPQWIVSSFAPISRYERWQIEGIRLGVARTKLAVGHIYSDLKTLNRLEQIAIKCELDQSVDDLIVLDHFDHVVEASAANLFWRKGQILYTPTLKHAGIHGAMRQYLLSLLLSEPEFVDLHLQQGQFSLTDVMLADEIWLTNSLLPIVPVAWFNGSSFSDFSCSHRLLRHMGYL
ncbi:aminodeoxychorismate lyase [Celerinatantimonas yamalensis]|uniref:Aminodeoxychorismate lyase n=1 Tax=Celerinatantimonas yamalensis TaxID=559956 RepID=A0ABW9G3J0_9GAMM